MNIQTAANRQYFMAFKVNKLKRRIEHGRLGVAFTG